MRSKPFIPESTRWGFVLFAALAANLAVPRSTAAQGGQHGDLSVLRLETLAAGKPTSEALPAVFSLESYDGTTKLTIDTTQMFTPGDVPGGPDDPCAGVSAEICRGDIGVKGVIPPKEDIPGFIFSVVEGPADTVPVFSGDCRGGRLNMPPGTVRSCRVTFVSADSGTDADAAVLVIKNWDTSRVPGVLPAGSLELSTVRDGLFATVDLANLRNGTEWFAGVTIGQGGSRVTIVEKLKAADWIGFVGGQCNSDDNADILNAGRLITCTVDNVALEASSESPDAVLRVETVVLGVPVTPSPTAAFKLQSVDGKQTLTLHTKQMYGAALLEDGTQEPCGGVTSDVCVGDIGAVGIEPDPRFGARFTVTVSSGPDGMVPVFSGHCGLGGRLEIPPGARRTCRVTFVHTDTTNPGADAAVLVTKNWDVSRPAGALPNGRLTLYAQPGGEETAQIELADLRNGTEWIAGVTLGEGNFALANIAEQIDAPGWTGFVGGECNSGDPADFLAPGRLLTCIVNNVAFEASVEKADAVLRVEMLLGATLKGTAAFKLESLDGKTVLPLGMDKMYRLHPSSEEPELCPGVAGDVCVGDLGVSGIIPPPKSFGEFIFSVTDKPFGTIPLFSGDCGANGRLQILPGSSNTCRVTFIRPDTGNSDADAAVLIIKDWDTSRSADALPGGRLELYAQHDGGLSGTMELADLRNGTEWIAGVTLGAHGSRATLVEKLDAPGWAGFVGGQCNSDDTSDVLTPGRLLSCTVLNMAVEVYPKPGVSIAGASVIEGDAGSKEVTLTVSLDSPPLLPVQIAYATANRTATAPADYTAKSGTLTIAAGETSGIIAVTVVGEILGEANETFAVILGPVVGGTLSVSEAIVTIVNDDDTSPPTIAAKSNVITETKSAPIAVPYTNPTATDLLDGPVPVTCQPKSGSTFPFGTTAVRCAAADKNGNIANSSFNVIVRLPTTSGAVTNPGTGKALTHVGPGQRVRVSAGGFGPGSAIDLRWVDSAGNEIAVATTTAAANGRFDVVVKVPVTAPLGAGQMTAVGVDAAGAEFVRGWLLNVVAK
jgi:hypothetical protein